MWVAKIKFDGKNAFLGGLAKNNSMSLSGYPIYVCEKETEILVDFIGFLIGPEEKEKDFIAALKKNPRIVYVEKEGNFVLSRIIESKTFTGVYSSKLIHLDPVIIKEDGTEYWTLGSWEKEHLMEFVDSVEKGNTAEVLSIGQKKIKNFAFLNVRPILSPKQELAMNLAIKRGYYEYPRKTDIDKLAKIAGISYSTFQAHLRKAENKFLPFCFKSFYTDFSD